MGREPFLRLALAIATGLARAPTPVRRGFGHALGHFAWWVARPRRRVTLTNLELCFPELDEASRRRLALEHFKVYARSFIDRFAIWGAEPERISRLCRLEGLEHLRALTEAGQPVIVLAPHFMGIDAGGLRLLLEQPMASMYVPQRSRALEQAMTRGRERLGATMIARREGVRPLLRWLRGGGVLHYSPDMDLGPREALFVPFLGVPAATVTALPRLARAAGAAILPMVTELTGQGYVARIHPPWILTDDDDDPMPVLIRMNQFIEAEVRRMPAQYLWSHRRFKTRPPGAPNPYLQPPNG